MSTSVHKTQVTMIYLIPSNIIIKGRTIFKKKQKKNVEYFYSNIINLFHKKRYLADEFSCIMDIDIAEDDVRYSIEPDIPQQENPYACGIYVCEYAEKIMRNASITILKKEDSSKIWKRIRMEIKSET